MHGNFVNSIRRKYILGLVNFIPMWDKNKKWLNQIRTNSVRKCNKKNRHTWLNPLPNISIYLSHYFLFVRDDFNTNKILQGGLQLLFCKSSGKLPLIFYMCMYVSFINNNNNEFLLFKHTLAFTFICLLYSQ